jgi:hypothetical protein
MAWRRLGQEARIAPPEPRAASSPIVWNNIRSRKLEVITLYRRRRHPELAPGVAPIKPDIRLGWLTAGR